MEEAYTKSAPSTFDEFTASRAYLEQVIRQLQSPEALKRRHDETEKTIEHEGQELCRLLYQAALDVRANNEERRASVTGEDREGKGDRKGKGDRFIFRRHRRMLATGPQGRKEVGGATDGTGGLAELSAPRRAAWS